MQPGAVLTHPMLFLEQAQAMGARAPEERPAPLLEDLPLPHPQGLALGDQDPGPARPLPQEQEPQEVMAPPDWSL